MENTSAEGWCASGAREELPAGARARQDLRDSREIEVVTLLVSCEFTGLSEKRSTCCGKLHASRPPLSLHGLTHGDSSLAWRCRTMQRSLILLASALAAVAANLAETWPQDPVGKVRPAITTPSACTDFLERRWSPPVQLLTSPPALPPAARTSTFRGESNAHKRRPLCAPRSFCRRCMRARWRGLARPVATTLHNTTSSCSLALPWSSFPISRSWRWSTWISATIRCCIRVA